jgi:hypothetical protein
MRSADEFDSRRQLWQNPIFTARRRTAVPLSERGDVIALGLRNARFFLDNPGAMSTEQEQALVREAKSLGVSRGGVQPNAQYLSLSGGGDKGSLRRLSRRWCAFDSQNGLRRPPLRLLCSTRVRSWRDSDPLGCT